MALVGSSGAKGLGGTGGVRAIAKFPASTKLMPLKAGGPFNSPVPGFKTPLPAASKKIAVSSPHITNAPVGMPASTGTNPGTPSTPGVTTTTEPSPYDSTYYIDLAAATQRATDQIAGYQRDIANSGVSTQNAIKQLQTNQGLATTNAQNVENSRGGFAQGALGNTIGQIGQNSLNAQSADTLRYQQDSENWNAAITGVNQGLSTEQIALGLASAARQKALGLTGTTTTTGGTPGTPATNAAGLPVGAPLISKTGVRLNVNPAANKKAASQPATLYSAGGKTLAPIRGGFTHGTAVEVKNPTGLQTTGKGRVIPKAPAKKSGSGSGRG